MTAAAQVEVPVEVIGEPERALVLLNPMRLALLEGLADPGSAADLARRLDLPRQRINYHLHELVEHRLIEVVEERRRGSVVERSYRRTGRSFAISTAALGRLGTDPDAIQDRFSSDYQVALASRVVSELGLLQSAAHAARKKLPTLALAVEVRFASAARRNAFAQALSNAVAELVREYHDEDAPGGRAFRFYLGAYPRPKENPQPKPQPKNG